jgi:hypothetical protein
MELNSLPAEVILSHPPSTLGHLYLDWNPQPGAYLEVEGQTYMVLERRHRYLLDGRWVIGDISCSYNARSELLRCAPNPSGPCDRCVHYQPF